MTDALAMPEEFYDVYKIEVVMVIVTATRSRSQKMTTVPSATVVVLNEARPF
jgi:hypothetical protein